MRFLMQMIERGRVGKHSWLTCVLAGFWLLFGSGAVSVRGAEYYADPMKGSMEQEGSKSAPWGSLEAVLEADKKFEVGDVLYLQDGYHGRPVIRGRNSGHVVIRAAEGARPTVSRLVVRGARGWRVIGLTAHPVEGRREAGHQYLFSVGEDSSNIRIENCVLYSTRDSAEWSKADWNDYAWSGIRLGGTDSLIRGNELRNVNFGITVSGDGNRVAGNVVENFCGDGMRGLGDNLVFEHNLVKNCYDVNDNHDDGFQSWSMGEDGVGSGVVKNLVLRGNRIINYVDPDQPLRGSLQGIGCFDGFFEGWVVENNLVVVDHWHGITLLGARDCRIINNTVADLNDRRPGPPWIRIGEHKDGSPSAGNVVRNNLATAYAIEGGLGEDDFNGEVEELSKWFRDPEARDFRLIADSPAIDVGSERGAPSMDILGTDRPMDGDGDGEAAWDLGAYERDSSTRSD